MNKRYKHFVSNKLPQLIGDAENKLKAFHNSVAESVEFLTAEMPETGTPTHETLAWKAEEAMYNSHVLWLLKPIALWLAEAERSEAEILERVTKKRARLVDYMVGDLSGAGYVGSSGPWECRSTSAGHNLSALVGANAMKYVIGQLSAALASFNEPE